MAMVAPYRAGAGAETCNGRRSIRQRLAIGASAPRGRDAVEREAIAIIRGLESTKATAMEPEHVNAIGNALEGLKERTAQLRRYL
jgi:hypothetical protein